MACVSVRLSAPFVRVWADPIAVAPSKNCTLPVGVDEEELTVTLIVSVPVENGTLVAETVIAVVVAAVPPPPPPPEEPPPHPQTSMEVHKMALSNVERRRLRFGSPNKNKKARPPPPAKAMVVLRLFG